jgi:hypothetical protein
MNEKTPAGPLKYADTYAPLIDARRSASAMGYELDWIVREARCAGDGKEARLRFNASAHGE